jgi:hypothetical protein
MTTSCAETKRAERASVRARSKCSQNYNLSVSTVLAIVASCMFDVPS